MSEAAREARNAYKRKWAKENPDKVKAATRRYWEKKAQEAEALEAYSGRKHKRGGGFP